MTFNVPNKPAKLQPLGQVLALFVKHGGKVIDSSPMYGNAEGVIGDLATKKRTWDVRFSLPRKCGRTANRRGSLKWSDR